jgi:CRP-like cAMP-binding protein
LYVIASGVLEITRQMETVTQTLGCLGAGAYVGEIGLLTGAPRAATATARTRCQVYQLSHEAIAPLLSKNPDLAFAFDKAVRLGLEILHREVAARAAESIGVRGQLLNRIRGFFLSAGKAAKP